MMMRKSRKKLWCCCLLMCWVSVNSSRFLTTHNAAIAPFPPHQQESPSSAPSSAPALVSKQVTVDKEEEEESVIGVSSRLGSRPPICEYKCRGCVPCEAIQIPTNSDRIGVQYANYEPEGWKCKCGASFFNP